MAPHATNDLSATGRNGSTRHLSSGRMVQEQDEVDPIAIVGFSFGFPDEAVSPDTFWKMLMEKRNTVKEFPIDRLSAEAMYHPDRNRRGQIPVRSGHFIQEDIAAFDAPFFSISATDAALMDPQQRKLLEYTYKALENAGMPMENVTGSKTSVYVGCFTNDWQHLSFKDAEQCGTTTALGTQACLNANRVSWFFNFTGNSANIDTACSSSLVALDSSCKELLRGDANMSIVGGCNLVFSPDNLHSLTNLNMLSPQGQCYSFDHRGDGYGRGEGFGILVLKRLSDAIRDEDTIRAIVRNSGCNQDGYTPGITQPNPKAQEALIRDTYASAGLSMQPTRYFEAHGTGTPVGDPIESTALGGAFRKVRTRQDPLWVGAVKSNIGHLEGCSGIAGVIKTILVLEKALIPPNTNFEQINSKIDTEFLKIKFPLEATPWPSKGLRRASINSFGNAGTNAHVILDDVYHYLQEHGLVGKHITVPEPPDLSFPASDPLQTPSWFSCISSPEPGLPTLISFSTHDEDGIKRQTSEYATHFKQLRIDHYRFRSYLDDLAYTLNVRRSSLTWKSFALIHSLDDLRNLNEIVFPPHKSVLDPKLAFAFTGQGAQWARMGQDLIAFPAYDRSLREAEEYLSTCGCPWLLREEMFKDVRYSSIDRPDLSQPLCTAIQIALIDLLYDFGIHPTAVVGHSSGEIAAAYSIGAISFRAALKIAYCRGIVAARLARTSIASGAMLSVGLSQNHVESYINDITQRTGRHGLTIACINSTKNVTVSGDTRQIDALKLVLDREEIFARKLVVDVAYHSPHMQAVAEEYSEMIQDLEKGHTPSKSIIMVSSVTGKMVTEAELLSPEYWVRNMISPVRFSDAISHLLSRSPQRIRKKIDLSHRKHFHINKIVEIGPHGALQGPIRNMLTESRNTSNISYTPLLKRGSSGVASTLTAIGQIQSLGYAVDLERINSGNIKDRKHRMTLPDLPYYQFDHSKKYWLESRISRRYRTHSQGKLDLLGKPVPDWNPLEARWRNNLRVSEMPWMEDHVVNGSLVYPGAGMLVMAIEAANQMADPGQPINTFELKDISFLRSITIPQEADGVETQLFLHLSQSDSNPVSTWSEFRLCAYESDQWFECCHGFIRVKYGFKPGEIDQGKEDQETTRRSRQVETEMSAACHGSMSPSSLYEMLSKSGLGYGQSFQRIQNGGFGDMKEAKGNISLFEWPENEYPQPHVVHPASLDAIFHLALAGYSDGGQRTVPTMIPTSLKYISVAKNGLSYPESTSVKTCTRMVAEDNRGTEWDNSVLSSSEDHVLVQLRGLRLTIIADASEDVDGQDTERQSCYHIEYQPDPELVLAKQNNSYDAKTQDQKIESVNSYLSLLIHQSPNLKILELDAARGGILDQELNALSTDVDHFDSVHMQYCALHYTDRSQAAIEEAGKQWQHRSNVIFERLNIEADPLMQGQEAGAYDIIIAANFLHQYKDTSVVLQHIHQLLNKGGKLLLSESTLTGHSSNDTGEDVQTVLSKNGFVSQKIQRLENSSAGSTDSYICISNQAPVGQKIKHIKIVTDPDSELQVKFSERLMTYLLSKDPLEISVISLDQASNVVDKDECLFIVLLEIDQPVVYNMPPEKYMALQNFLVSAQDVLWVHHHASPEFNAITGLARVLRNEYDEHRLTTLALTLDQSVSDEQLQYLGEILERNHLRLTTENNDTEYVELNGVLNIPRIVQTSMVNHELHIRSIAQQSGLQEVQNAPPLKLTIESPGLLDTLKFVEDKTVSQPLGDSELEIETRAIGMNFKDCLIALGQISGSSFGLECAGIVTRVGQESELVPGDRVLMAAPGCFKTHSRGFVIGTHKIPHDMSFTEAAAIPAQFGTAWAVVHQMARIQKGETILIHAAAGGTGQAVIQIARYLGAIPYATVSSQSKKQLLIDEYGISEDHIFDSRNTTFAKGIMRVTQGKGVDIIINSLSGDALVASWECIAPYGRFVEIGKKDIMSNSNLPMFAFRKNASFIGFDASSWLEERPLQVQECLRTLVDLFAKKILHMPRHLHVHSITEVGEAFRALSSGKVLGKVVLEVSPSAQVQTSLETKPSFDLDSNATYVIAGGLGGIGRSIARWMVGRKAKNFILLSRSGGSNDTARDFLREVREHGAHVEAPACDITNTKTMKEVLESLLRRMPPVKGCVQASMVPRDGMFKNMSYDDWTSGVNCKTIGSWNLHTLLPSQLDFFILLSSASGIAGLRGQANYDAGNTYEDALARFRVAHGQKAVSLDLGAMVEDGILAERPEFLNRVLAYGALEGITRRKFYGILDYYCNPALPTLTPTESQVVIGIGHSGGPGLDSIDLSRQPMLQRLVLQANRRGTTGQGSSGGNADNPDEVNPRDLFSDSSSLLDAGTIVIQAVIRKLSKSLSTLQGGTDAVDVHKPIQSFGVDSLLAVELRNWIVKEFKADVAVFEIQGGSTFSTLGMMVAGRSGLKHGGWNA